jgi:exonuclease SbcC
MIARLDTLLIENFRSIKGQIVVPLNAQVVLIHGTNGMGKTSVLTALELALTGRVAHLAANGDGYRTYLTNVDATAGSISVTTSAPLAVGEKMSGNVTFGEAPFVASPLLTEEIAKFFAERSYLPQATLGRLLEIYNQPGTSTNSPLTKFVNEILGLDPLDALVDGLYPAFHVARIKNLVPEYRRFEALGTAASQATQSAAQTVSEVSDRLASGRDEASRLLGELGLEPAALDTPEQIEAVRTALSARQAEGLALAVLETTRAELRAITKAWSSLPSHDAEREQATRDHLNQLAAEGLSAWRQGPGAKMQALLDGLRNVFPDLPSLDDGPTTARDAALVRAAAEKARCDSLTSKSEAATTRRNALVQIIERSGVRLVEIDNALSTSAENTKTLATALAAVAPHIHTEQCPVCDRNFSDLARGPLSAHVARKIAELTGEAGRLQALSAERAEVTGRLSVAQRDLLAAQTEILSPSDQASLTNRASQMSGIVTQLSELERDVVTGAALISTASQARDAAAVTRRAAELSASILPEVDRLVRASLGQPFEAFETVDQALSLATEQLEGQIAAAERAISTRIAALSQLEAQARNSAEARAAIMVMATAVAREAEIDAAVTTVGGVREIAKVISEAAQRSRSKIVKQVFNTALNRTWRDLFVRLTPSEDFVPLFKIPEGDKDRAEAVLETIHRSGRPSGSPGSMLSQGNLNTAALTLFLALHLSVPAKTPWLILDDPVQSMDDVHIAQFAALLRSLSKGVGRQIVVAVHERALFDYLTLELSPAFAGDSLITVEISRGYDGVTVATPTAHTFEDDQVVAAA